MPNDSDDRGSRPRTARSYSTIIEATMAALREAGYHDLTIEGVAARAGVGKATVYRWWPTKPKLVVEAIRYSLDNQRPGQVPLVSDSGVVARELVRRIVDRMTSPVGHMIAAMSLDLYGDPEAARELSAVLETYRAKDIQVVFALISRGDVPHDVDPHVLIDIISGTALAGVLVGRGARAGLVDQLTDLVLEGRLPRTTT